VVPWSVLFQAVPLQNDTAEPVHLTVPSGAEGDVQLAAEAVSQKIETNKIKIDFLSI
jgi:hypothetical protein